MASSLVKSEVQDLITKFNKGLKNLEDCCNLDGRFRDDIKAASDKLQAKSIHEILNKIPVDEINRDKRGFRVKALRSHGYETIADIVAAEAYDLSRISGISDYSAFEMKCAAEAIAKKARKNARFRISEDNKTAEANELIRSLYRFSKIRPTVQRAEKLLHQPGKSIKQAIIDLGFFSNKLKWTFTLPQNKVKTMRAHTYLVRLIDVGFLAECELISTKANEISTASSSLAWRDFTVNSIKYFNTLEYINPQLFNVPNLNNELKSDNDRKSSRTYPFINDEPDKFVSKNEIGKVISLEKDRTIYGLPEDFAREINDQSLFPKGLLCVLRRYQEWGVKYILHQGKVLLGDEMGLGKTVQAIAAMVSLRNTEETHFMVVCPASVLTNWCREVVKMSKLKSYKVHGPDREAALNDWLRYGGVAVTTYETTKHLRFSDNFKIGMLVVDEAHYIKNPEAQRTKNVKSLITHTDRLLFMTGTALENRVNEMIALMKMLQPHIANKAQTMTEMVHAPFFRECVVPVYYRRKREDVLRELPELIESEEWCNLLPAEEAVYEEAILNKKFNEARRVSWNINDLSQSSKTIRLLDLINEAKSDGRKILVFSFFLDTLDKIKNLLGKQCLQPINGSVPPQRRQEIIDEFESAPAGTVLVSQIQAGGTGLNIQSASVVIICEPQWKPSTENQAISRAYRMGQTRNVLVYRLLCVNTVDERITALLKEKQMIFDEFADESVAADKSKELDKAAFSRIIEEEIDRINEKRNTLAETRRVMI